MVAGGWFQTVPADLSDKEIQWYTWGFPGKATFAAKITGLSDQPVVIALFGQICNAETCRSVDVEIQLDPVANRIVKAPDLRKLIRVQDPPGDRK